MGVSGVYKALQLAKKELEKLKKKSNADFSGQLIINIIDREGKIHRTIKAELPKGFKTN